MISILKNFFKYRHDMVSVTAEEKEKANHYRQVLSGIAIAQQERLSEILKEANK